MYAALSTNIFLFSALLLSSLLFAVGIHIVWLICIIYLAVFNAEVSDILLEVLRSLSRANKIYEPV